MGDGETLPPLGTATRPSIFLKLNKADAVPRELAWRQFYERYAPVIAGYARRTGAPEQQAEEVVQNVISGFFEASPRFEYDPKRGRFRGYLKTCVGHAMASMQRSAARVDPKPVEELEVPDASADDDEIWEKLWRQQIVRRAVEIAREQYTRKGKLQTFLAFEQNVLLGIAAPDVAAKLGMNVGSVH